MLFKTKVKIIYYNFIFFVLFLNLNKLYTINEPKQITVQ
jgi:hypothetical protein